MKRVLIFTASTGGGHNQVALSLEMELSQKGYQVIKLDLLKEISKVLDVIISDGYRVLASRMPKVYGGLYKISDARRVNKRMNNVFGKVAYKRVHQIILEQNPDLIIGSHAFANNLVGQLKRDGKVKSPFISVVTDYEAHQTYIHREVDAYITGSYYTAMTFVNRGVPRDKLHPYGIPIKREFLEEQILPKKEQSEVFTVLLMGGSMGVRAIRKVLKYLVKMDLPLKVITVCGNDEALRRSIEKRYAEAIESGRVVLYGFTKEVSKLMSQSDVIITKPGGLTVSESIAKQLPMIIPYFIPGQEKDNTGFLVKAGVAIEMEDLKELPATIKSLHQNPKRLVEMKTNMRTLSQTYSIEKTIALAERLMNQS